MHKQKEHGELPQKKESNRKRPLDSREAVKYWREALEPLAEGQSQSCIIRARREFNDLSAKTVRRKGDVFRVSKKRAKELLSNKIEIVEKL